MRAASEKKKVVAIVGPTGSGKTALTLLLAEILPVEVIACDSRTVYRGMDIGTAKPTAVEQEDVKHHMIDLINPDQNYTVAEFRRKASSVIDEIHKWSRVPVVCGGTGFYARALLEGLEMPEVAPQPELRTELQQFAEENGNQALWDRLNILDPPTADRLNPNDRFRIIRAMEVTQVMGKPFSQVARRVDPPYETIWIGLTANDRMYLYKKIADRFETQVQDGIIEEVEDLLHQWGPTRAILNTVNYREITKYLQGQLTRTEALDEAVRHNNHLARKQLIWFRSNPAIKWFAIDEMSVSELYVAVTNYINSQNTV